MMMIIYMAFFFFPCRAAGMGELVVVNNDVARPVIKSAGARRGFRRPSSLVVNATTRHLLVMGSIPNWATTSAKRTLRSRVPFPESPRPGNA